MYRCAFSGLSKSGDNNGTCRLGALTSATAGSIIFSSDITGKLVILCLSSGRIKFRPIAALAAFVGSGKVKSDKALC